jgi:glycosyltransferase involved in cell wall biosynthesis
MPKIVHKLRQWDFVAAQRPDFFIANSKNTASRIKKYYDRESEIIYPGVDTSNFELNENKEDFYLYV